MEHVCQVCFDANATRKACGHIVHDECLDDRVCVVESCNGDPNPYDGTDHVLAYRVLTMLIEANVLDIRAESETFKAELVALLENNTASIDYWLRKFTSLGKLYHQHRLRMNEDSEESRFVLTHDYAAKLCSYVGIQEKLLGRAIPGAHSQLLFSLEDFYSCSWHFRDSGAYFDLEEKFRDYEFNIYGKPGMLPVYLSPYGRYIKYENFTFPKVEAKHLGTIKVCYGDYAIQLSYPSLMRAITEQEPSYVAYMSIKRDGDIYLFIILGYYRTRATVEQPIVYSNIKENDYVSQRNYRYTIMHHFALIKLPTK